MPSDLIQALMKSDENPPPGVSPFGMEAPRPEDAIRDLYRSSPSSSNWLNGIRSATQAMDPVSLLGGPPGPQTGSIPQDLIGSLGLAGLGAKPTVSYTNTPRPTLRSQGRIVSQNRPVPPHPATRLAPGIAAADIAANTGLGNLPTTADRNLTSERPIEMPGAMVPSSKGDRLPMAGDAFGDRFGSMAPPSSAPEMGAMRKLPDPEMGAMRQLPTIAAGGMGKQQPVPLPRPRPMPAPQPRTAQAGPGVDVSIVDFLRSLGLR